MDGLNYCERHQRAFELMRVADSWIFICPQCMWEGRCVTWSSTSVPMNFMGQSLFSDHTNPNKNILEGRKETKHE